VGVMDAEMKERGRSKESVIQQFNETVLPMYKKYVEPDGERLTTL